MAAGFFAKVKDFAKKVAGGISKAVKTAAKVVSAVAPVAQKALTAVAPVLGEINPTLGRAARAGEKGLQWLSPLANKLAR